MTDGIIVGIDGDGSLAGGGIADSAQQIVNSLNAQDPLAVMGGGIAAGLDLLGVITNPVDAIGTSTMGWLVEHLWFLDGFLDNTVGDPNAVENATNELTEAGATLDGIAATQVGNYAKVSVYRAGISLSKQRFEQRVEPRAETIHLQSIACTGLGRAISFAGTWIAILRGMIRDLLAEFAWWVLQEVTIAMAVAPFTGGGSIATAATRVVFRGVELSRNLATKMMEFAGKLQEISAIMKQLAGFLDSLPGKVATSAVKNTLPAVGKGFDDDADLYTPTKYTRAQQATDGSSGSSGSSEPLGPYQPTQAPPPPQEPCDPAQPQSARQASTWQTSGTLDEP